MRTVELEDEVASLLEADQPLEREAHETLVMDLFRRGKVSTGRACKLLGLDRTAFAQRAAARGIPYFLMDKEEWEAEKATIDAWDQS
jgi:predicted HTH domain antitoxin